MSFPWINGQQLRFSLAILFHAMLRKQTKQRPEMKQTTQRLEIPRHTFWSRLHNSQKFYAILSEADYSTVRHSIPYFRKQTTQ